MPQPPSRPKKSPAPALDRGLELLGYLRRQPKGATVAEMAAALSIPPASAYRLVNTMEERRFIVRDPDGQRYRLGSEILLLAGSILAGLTPRAVAAPHMQELFNRTKETVELAVLESEALVVIDKVEGEESVHILNIGGHRSPFMDSAGLVLLSGLDETRLAQLIEGQMKSDPKRMVFRPRRLPAILEQIRKQGYMADEGPAFNQPRRRSRRVAVALRDHEGRLRAALSIAVAVSRWKPERAPRLARQLKSAARRINSLMGFREQVGDKR